MTENRKRSFGFETKMLHAGHIPDAVTGARAVPIYQTTSYVFEDTDYAAQLFELKQYGNIYTRINNPTTAVFEERMAALENGTGALAVASGMAAQFTTMMTLLEPGDEVVASAHLYGGTVTQFTHTFKKLGIKVHFVDPTDIEQLTQHRWSLSKKDPPKPNRSDRQVRLRQLEELRPFRTVRHSLRYRRLVRYRLAPRRLRQAWRNQCPYRSHRQRAQGWQRLPVRRAGLKSP